MQFMENLKNFAESFNPDVNLLKIFIIQLAFILLIFVLFSGFNFVMEKQVSRADYLFQKMTGSADIVDTVDFVEGFRLFLTIFIGYIIVGFVLILGAWSYTRKLIWQQMMKIKEISLFQFIWLKFLWLLFWLPWLIILVSLVFIASSAFRLNPSVGPIYAGIIYLNLLFYIIIMYFGMFMNKSYFTHKKKYRAFVDAFRNGGRSIRYLIMPILLSFAGFVVLTLIIYGLELLNLGTFFVNLVLFVYVLSAETRFVISRIND